MYDIVINGIRIVVYFVLGILLNISLGRPFGIPLLVLFAILCACELFVMAQNINWYMENRPKQRSKKKKEVVFWKRFLVLAGVMESVAVLMLYILKTNGIEFPSPVTYGILFVVLIVSCFFV